MKNTRFLRYILVGIMACATGGAWGDDYTWNGGATGVWALAANWTSAGPDFQYPGFNATDTATIGAGATVTLNIGGLTVVDVTLSTTTSQLDLGANSITVTGTFTNNGTVRLTGAGAQAVGGIKVNGGTSTVEYYGGATANPAWGTDYRTVLQLGTTVATVAGTVSNAGSIEINGAGSIDASDNTQGTFIYSTATHTVPALNGYYNLSIPSSTQTLGASVAAANDITVALGATFNLSGFNASVTGTFTNNGTVRLTGAGAQAVGGIKVNGGTSTVEYYGGATANPAWGTDYRGSRNRTSARDYPNNPRRYLNIKWYP